MLELLNIMPSFHIEKYVELKSWTSFSTVTLFMLPFWNSYTHSMSVSSLYHHELQDDCIFETLLFSADELSVYISAIVSSVFHYSVLWLHRSNQELTYNGWVQ